ncbi:MAG: hypothetical protein JXP48_14470 [Acidobacteria bacterium]|nr:hypothetical protein [Acidobacteriota bacterium]
MGKSGLWVLLLVLGAEVALAGEGENPGKPPPLTAEQREILRNRAILEDLELLENLDKCRLLDLFLEDPETPAAQTGKDEGKKK